MKKRVLLVLDRDQFTPFPYLCSVEEAGVRLGGNSGNSVFQFALQKLLSVEHEVTIDVDFLHKTYDQSAKEWINAHFDAVVFSPANCIARYAVAEILPRWASNCKGIHIPIFAIGMGAQSDAEYSTGFLREVGAQATELIDAILRSGGHIGARGYFTSECLERLGFREGSNFTPIGCPSMYMNGDAPKVSKSDITEESFRPAINGFRSWDALEYDGYFEKYDTAIFVCQDEFYRLIYAPDQLTEKEIKYISSRDSRWMRLYAADRIKLYCDYPSWTNDLLRLSINFSFGCRIHGNIVALLNGIPAFVDAFDSRVKELSEFFAIPHKTYEGALPDPYEAFMEADYSRFNRVVSERFAAFAAFMERCGLRIPRSEVLARNTIPDNFLAFRAFAPPDTFKRMIVSKSRDATLSAR